MVTFLNTILFFDAVSCSGCDAVSLSLVDNSEHNYVGGGGNSDTVSDKHITKHTKHYYSMTTPWSQNVKSTIISLLA